MQKTDAFKILRDAGIINPYRLVDLMNKTIESLNLDLSNLVVLTEAASNFFVVTPVIAALSGAKRVIALTQDSKYAKVEEVITQTHALEILCDITDTIEIHTDKPLSIFTEADIITNLGFVRPINKSIIKKLKPTAVIPLMYETWEFRPSDVDLEACRLRGITVAGTNEDYPGLDVFNYCGWLALQMLLNAGVEGHKSRVMVVGGDKFGHVIVKRLQQAGIQVSLRKDLRDLHSSEIIRLDALLVADYSREDIILGDGGDISAKELALLAPGIVIVQFAGRMNLESLQQARIQVYPGMDLPARRMAKTLAEVGVRPVVELHTAGLKVGEICVRNSRKNLSSKLDQYRQSEFSKLIQKVVLPLDNK